MGVVIDYMIGMMLQYILKTQKPRECFRWPFWCPDVRDVLRVSLGAHFWPQRPHTHHTEGPITNSVEVSGCKVHSRYRLGTRNPKYWVWRFRERILYITNMYAPGVSVVVCMTVMV